MKYPNSHWEKVAYLWNKGMLASEIQDHYPNTTLATVKRWIRKCRDLGMLK